MNYIISKNSVKLNNNIVLTNNEIVMAINYANNAIKELQNQTSKFNIDIFDTLGMRNLSGFVGEVFVSSVENISGDKFVKNIHQDGYPDLLLNDTEDKKSYLDTCYTTINGKKSPKDKELFSPYKYGGLEVKATCGSVPAATPGHPKLTIGEQGIAIMNSFDWKAHHRTTNNLLGVLWDFIDSIPTIVAIFYRNDLVVDDWGKIVHPKENGGRTTSVSIMTKDGVRKMCQNWIAIIDEPKYIDALSAKKWIGNKITKQ